MKSLFHETWGSACGPVKRFAPQTRLLCGLILFFSALILPVYTLTGVLSATVLVLMWWAACRPSGWLTLAFSLVGLLMFLPYFLLIPIIPTEEVSGIERWKQGFFATWNVVFHGMAGLYITTMTMTTVTVSELRRGIFSLPIPTLISAILLQIVHQSAALMYETRQVTSAIRVRGAAGGGLSSWRVLFAFPKVWLPRVIFRADRVSAAMEIRGFCENEIQRGSAPDWAVQDRIALLCAFILFAISVLIRIFQGS